MRNFMRNIGGALGLALSIFALAGLITPSVAQVIPSTSTTQRQPSPRFFQTQQTSYIRTTLTFNMCVQSSNVCKIKLANASLPYNSIVKAVNLYVYTAFNSTSSDTLTLGTTSANANEIVSSTMSLHSQATVAGSVVSTSYLSTGNTTAQSGSNGGFDLWAAWTAGTGNTATTGLASLVVEYYPPNDGNCTPEVAFTAAPAGC